MTLNSKKNMSVDDMIVDGVLDVLDSHRDSVWLGTMTDLNSALVRVLGRKDSKVLPKSPSSLRVVLNRVANRLRNRSVGVRFIRSSDHSRTRYVRFTQ